MLTGPLRYVTTPVLETAFVNGLREDIRAELRLWSPIGLPQIMSMAQQIEDKNLAVQANGYGPFPWVGWPTHVGSYLATRTIHTQPITHSQPPNLKSGTPGNSHQKPYLSPPPQPFRSHPLLSPHCFQQMMDTEMQDKSSKGLCFRCDEKFASGHCCKQKEFHVIWVRDDEYLFEDGSYTISTDVEQAIAGIGDVEEDPQPLSLSLSSMVGLSAPHSVKIRGRIKDREVIVLIDSGASHNFISATLVEELGLEMS